MKLKTMILLSGLLLVQIVATPVSASDGLPSSMEVQGRGHKAHIRKHQQHERSRSVLPIVSDYVEDNVLYLSFSLPLSNVQIRVIDGETGKIVFEGVVSGTSLPITLERDSESFEVYIK